MVKKYKAGINAEQRVIQILKTWPNMSEVKKRNDLDKLGIDISYYYNSDYKTFGQIKPFSFLKTKEAKNKWKIKMRKLVLSNSIYDNTYIIIYSISKPLEIIMIKHWRSI